MSPGVRAPVGRVGAALIHLGISALVATVVVSLMLFVWYPWPYFKAMGGNNLAMIIVGVDVALGPLVTLIVFDRAKGWWLRFDLAVVAALQLTALAYGFFIVAEARPVYMIFSVDRFELTAYSQVRDEELAKVKRPEFKAIPWGRARIAGAKIPADPNESFRIVESALQGNDLSTFPQHFVPYADVADAVIRKSRPVAELRGRAADAPQLVAKALADVDRPEAEVRWLPLKGRVNDVAVLVDAKTGAVLGYVEVYPW